MAVRYYTRSSVEDWLLHWR